jgi:hypothetical protein
VNWIPALVLFLALPLSAQADPPRGLSKQPTPSSTSSPSTEVKSTPAPQPALKPARPTPQPVDPEEDSPSPVPTTAREGTTARWFGHAFIYLTSQGGVRIAINPFTEGTVDYTLPERLPADIVLISSEAADYSGGQQIFGIPQIFRSLAGVGANRANGIPFRGINTWRDNEAGKRLGRNTVYVIELDGQRFCHVGTLGHPLSSRDAASIGQVDVLFLPVGTLELSPREILRNAEILGAKWIVPVAYKTQKNSKIPLRPYTPSDFGTLPTESVASSEFIFNSKSLPQNPTLLLLRAP